jgi:hypothetical protein
MGWMGGEKKQVHHSVMWLPRGAKPGMFSNLPLPGGGMMRVLDKSLHLAALGFAGRKLLELRHKSGKRQPGL